MVRKSRSVSSSQTSNIISNKTSHRVSRKTLGGISIGLSKKTSSANYINGPSTSTSTHRVERKYSPSSPQIVGCSESMMRSRVSRSSNPSSKKVELNRFESSQHNSSRHSESRNNKSHHSTSQHSDSADYVNLANNNSSHNNSASQPVSYKPSRSYLIERSMPSKRVRDPHFVDGRKLPTEDNLLAQENFKVYSQLRRRPSSGESGSWKYRASRDLQGGMHQTVSPLFLKEKADSHSLGQSPSFHFSSLLSPKYRNRQILPSQEKNSALKGAKKRLPHWLVVLISAGIIVVVLGLIILSAWICLLSPLARINASSLHIVDAQSQWVDTPSVEATADKLLGQPLYFSHTREIETALRNVKGVDNVQITKKFPNQINLKIIPFVPQAIVKDKAGILKVVARTGAILGTITKPVEGLPIINIDDAVADKTLTQAAILQGLQVLHQIPPVIHSTLVEMSAFNQDSVTTKSANGLTIIWGNASNMRLKVAVVEHILVNKAIMQGKSVIDVSVPDKPIVK